MGFLYQHDGQRLRPEFTCPCGSKRAERVKVTRADGSTYETEFAKCYMCCAMYHWPQPVPAFIPDGGPPATWGMVGGSGTGGGDQLSQQQHNDILSKAAAARKSRKRR